MMMILDLIWKFILEAITNPEKSLMLIIVVLCFFFARPIFDYFSGIGSNIKAVLTKPKYFLFWLLLTLLAFILLQMYGVI